MYIRIKKKQEEIIKLAIQKAGTYRKLEKITNIPKSSLYRYEKLEAIPEKRFQGIIKFLGINENRFDLERLEDNWKQILGGKKGVIMKKENGTFSDQLNKAQKKGAKKIKEWHKNMKEKNPKEYYLKQYEKFKKIGGYNQVTKNGEKVRNLMEKETADKLRDLKIKYKYEPLIKTKERWFFPDFLIEDKIILECTAWNGETKAYQLLEKIEHLKSRYKVFVIIPKHLYTKYKILDKHLILGVSQLDLVAQLVERVTVNHDVAGSSPAEVVLTQ